MIDSPLASPVKPLQIAVLMTCFERKAQTLACLQSLAAQQGLQQNFICQLYLVDAGSDGTGSAVAAVWPQAQIQQVSADVYWNQGMLLAWQQAVQQATPAKPIDFYLWLNDDVQLLPDALLRLLACYRHLQSALSSSSSTSGIGVVLGAMRQPQEQSLSYGGRRRRYAWHPLALGPILAEADTPQVCDFINGNCCLIPAALVKRVGLLAPEFSHSMGDYDYGLRLKKLGFASFQAPGWYGYCARRPFQGSVLDASLPFGQRLMRLKRPNEHTPPAQWRIFVRRHGGWLWPLLWSQTWLRQCWPALWLWLKQRPPSAGTST